MTPSTSIQSFTGMFDSGGSSNEKIPRQSESKGVVSKIRPPTNIASGSSQDTGSKIPTQTQQSKQYIKEMIEKIEIKSDEMKKEDDASHDISSMQSPTSRIDSKEIQEYIEKIKDLESKLNTLMVKRAEDRQKFKEFERIKIQNEQLVENKKQMAEKIADLSRKNSSLEKAAQEAKDEQIRQADEIKDLIDNAEMAVIDKEMAENKAEQLQIQLEQCREQLEEAKLDFEILKTEIEDKGVDGAANSFELKKLEEQNARYKEALLKLRDISAADRNNLKILQKDVETKNDEITNLIQSSDKTKSELNDCYEQIKDLKVRF